MKVFRLEVINEHGGLQNVCGDQDMIMGAYREVLEAMAAPDIGRRVIEVNGVCNDASTSEVRIAFLASTVVCCAVIEQ